MLKEKNFSPGDISGNLSDPSTMGAVAALQKQCGLDVTGVIDNETENALQNCEGKIVSENRSNESVTSLRAKGSETIAAADSIHTSAHGLVASGISAVTVGGASIIENIKDQTDNLNSVAENIPGLSARLSSFVEEHFSVLAITALGLVLIYIAIRLYSNAGIVISERVRKSKSGEDMSH
jgi:hypothetical protein